MPKPKPKDDNWNSPDFPLLVLIAWGIGFMALCSFLHSILQKPL
jgi:hypothetical protein